MIKAIIFDWSGTLCDDYHSVSYGIKEKILNPELAKKIFFHPLISIFREALSLLTIKMPNLLIKESSNVLFSSPRLFPYVKEIILLLKRHHLITGIISTQSQKAILQILKKNDLYSYLDFIEGGVLHKTAYINKFSRKFSLKKHEILYISDLAEDIIEAKRTKVRTCAITWGYDSLEKLKLANPTLIIHALKQIKEVINSSK